MVVVQFLSADEKKKEKDVRDTLCLNNVGLVFCTTLVEIAAVE
jgi:hypothetical protein